MYIYTLVAVCDFVVGITYIQVPSSPIEVAVLVPVLDRSLKAASIHLHLVQMEWMVSVYFSDVISSLYIPV